MWSGTISFGLVNVPIKLYPAIREHSIHFHQLDKASGSRIRHQKVAEKTGRPVDSEDLELGYEVEKGKLVVVDTDELDALHPETTRTIDISDFVELAEIDPVHYARTYWVAPDGDAAARPYRLLVGAMEESGRAGVGMVVMRNKQYLAAIRARDHALALSTMHFADEVVDRSTVDAIPPGKTKPPTKELDLARQIIDSLATSWQPSRYRDTYTDEVQKLIKRHEKGQDVVVDEPAPSQAKITDLTKALQASLDAARKARGRQVGDAFERAREELTRASDEGDKRDAGADGGGQGRGDGSKRSAAQPAPGKTAARKTAPRSRRATGSSGSKKGSARASGTRKSA
jgi:DNA end-binding protein Ku